MANGRVIMVYGKVVMKGGDEGKDMDDG